MDGYDDESELTEQPDSFFEQDGPGLFGLDEVDLGLPETDPSEPAGASGANAVTGLDLTEPEGTDDGFDDDEPGDDEPGDDEPDEDEPGEDEPTDNDAASERAAEPSPEPTGQGGGDPHPDSTTGVPAPPDDGPDAGVNEGRGSAEPVRAGRAGGHEPPLALYRRYRPETFAEVIGQEHVTEPLQRALINNRVNHAYLFSGPRGCGKTSSARILARALNCEQGPTPVPCGQCQSCRDLARGGPGSIDVIEIDAASHGGVEDARDLRERAFFAPVSSRYKIYIVDEAHMVTTAGFNALLKLVEEPPPHVKFIFATTEPDKVIGTIRSRTHHYPFRLVPPKTLSAYLADLCEREGVTVAPAALPLVVRAGAGSVRDSLSVLDQLLGGASESGVSYQQASALLGYTPDSLLDAIVDAFAAGDAQAVFATIDRVIETGQDPRRFAEDLLRRLRDLVIVAAVPNAVSSGLIDVADDQAERLGTQAAGLGPGEIARAAEVIATGLTEMRGTTAPRLHLELMCARILLPGADVDERGIHARLDRLERRIGVAGGAPAEPTPIRGKQWDDVEVPAPPAESQRPAPQPEPAQVIPIERGRRPEPEPSTELHPQQSPARDTATEAPPEPSPAPTAPAQGAGLSVADLRRLWPQVLDEVKSRRRFAWILLSQNAQVLGITGNTLTLAFNSAGARDNFTSGGSHDVLRDAMVQVIGADLRVEAIVNGGQDAPAGARAPQGPRARTGAPAAPAPEEAPSAPAAPPSASHADQVRQLRQSPATPAEPGAEEADHYEASADDPMLDESGESATELIARQLGAEIIAEEET